MIKKVECIIPFIDILMATKMMLFIVLMVMIRTSGTGIPLGTVSGDPGAGKTLNDPVYVVLTKDGLSVGKEKTDMDNVKRLIKGKEVVLSADGSLASAEVFGAYVAIKEAGKNVFIEVKK